jgi:1-pyrroline-5-carboxylate dehydrogenase
MFLSKTKRYQSLLSYQQRPFSKILNAFATVDPNNLGPNSHGHNLVNGEWKKTAVTKDIVDPMTGKHMLTQPNTQKGVEAKEFIDWINTCPKSGLHNPFKNKERYLMLGEVSRKLVEAMQDK